MVFQNGVQKYIFFGVWPLSKLEQDNFPYFCAIVTEKDMEKQILLGKTPAEIQEVVEKLELPKFTGKQIVDWIYQKRCASIEDMTNLSKASRAY